VVDPPQLARYQVDSRAFPLSTVVAVQVLDAGPVEPAQLSAVRARWAVDHDGGVFTVPAAFSDETGEFATVVHADLCQLLAPPARPKSSCVDFCVHFVAET